MAKQIDSSKIERIRTAAVALISEQGISNCSVAAIAQRAGVSVGYLYRHYNGKEALINDMLEVALNIINEKISGLIEAGKSIDQVISGVVRYLFDIAEQDPEKFKFLIMLFNDFSIGISRRLTDRIRTIADDLLAIGRANGAIRPETTVEDLYMAVVGLPMQYLSLRYRGILQSPAPTSRGVDRIVRIAIGIVSENNQTK
ncbi:MAG: TetR/AcrR family transcriptional regulator [Rikenellaceae bacterium]|nr:TetR/AcrR family transcriptional regulator [Rikenellaceae bacterium]